MEKINKLHSEKPVPLRCWKAQPEGQLTSSLHGKHFKRAVQLIRKDELQKREGDIIKQPDKIAKESP